MTTTLVAVPATPGEYVDTSTPVTRNVATQILLAGKTGIFRYVPLPNNSAVDDISAGELADLCAAGLLVGLVQHVRSGPGSLWIPSDHDPVADADAAFSHALLVGYPLGAHVFLDLEAINDTLSNTVAYCVGWQKTVIAAGYEAGLYHGFSVPLSSRDLFELPGFNCYFTDMANRRVAVRGNAIVQGSRISIGGTAFDTDQVEKDLLGGLPFVAGAIQIA